MCEYCTENKNILEKVVINPSMLQWCSNIKPEDLYIHEYPLGVFMDRGYLRLVDIEDSQCLDHGEKIKIKYCPFCGMEL